MHAYLRSTKELVLQMLENMSEHWAKYKNNCKFRTSCGKSMALNPKTVPILKEAIPETMHAAKYYLKKNI